MRNKTAAMVLGTALVSCGTQQDNASDTNIVGGDKVSTSDPIVKSTVALVTPSGKYVLYRISGLTNARCYRVPLSCRLRR